jgi:2-polyprenyl-3-methyl-5-hydroxy-6-metoxy-1,4-benzoquinol methylase
VRIDFSKPLGDVSKESSKHFDNNEVLLDRQRQISERLNFCEMRPKCVVCEHSLLGVASFKHRFIDYVKCSFCGHIQSKAQPPEGYPTRLENGLTFSQIYPELTAEEYESRKKRIYTPKLEWALNCHQDLRLNKEELLKSTWLELGCGAGYFLGALADVGVKNFLGLENDLGLMNIANKILKKNAVRHFQNSLAKAVSEYRADIYVAFFVLEHIEDTKCFFEAMRKQRKGTILFFSVPTYGFGTILESAFNHYFARSLDSVVHTQLFTDSSIKYCLDHADYEMVAQWIFGQDSNDLLRMIITSLEGNYPEPLYHTIYQKIMALQDPIQNIIDKHQLADSRHILAIKR